METSNGLSLHFNTLWSFSGRKVTGDKLSYFVCVPCRSRSFEIDILVESPCPRDNHKSWILWRRMEATGFNRFLAAPTCLYMVKCVRDGVKNRPEMTLVNSQAAEEKCNVQMRTTYCLFTIWLNDISCMLLKSIGFVIHDLPGLTKQSLKQFSMSCHPNTNQSSKMQKILILK